MRAQQLLTVIMDVTTRMPVAFGTNLAQPFNALWQRCQVIGRSRCSCGLADQAFLQSTILCDQQPA